MANTVTTCSNIADYSKEVGSELPFKFELDTVNSVLNPPDGVNQKFVYIVTATPQDMSIFEQYHDLSHFVLEICPTLSIKDILNPEATLKGTLSFVYNDQQTGCTGLKYDFDPDMSKNVGVTFKLTFELANPLPIGPVDVCIYGGGQELTNLTICGPVCGGSEFCETTAYQPLNVCAPVTVTPIVKRGIPTTTCCGKPVITSRPCEFTQSSCTFSIVQRICVAVPLSFSATATVGDEKVSCDTPSDSFCSSCNEGITNVIPLG